MRNQILRTVLWLALLAAAISPRFAHAADLLAIDFDGVLYDIDQLTGAASNPRASGVYSLSGLAFAPQHGLLAHDAATNNLFRLNRSNGAATNIGFIGIDVTEGDLAFDPISGQLYGTQSTGGDRLYTINPTTGLGTIVGTIAQNADISGMAFDASGTLWVLDTAAFPQTLYTVNPLTAGIINSYSLIGDTLGSTAGMSFDPDTGWLYIVHGDQFAAPGTNKLYFMTDPTGGFLREVGLTGVTQGFSGLLFIPEPGTLALLFVAGSCLIRRRQR